ncbi:unnamed protein product [Meloidogyne enterolobii]|uniref:Uncharacterized protein n=1 Tax=Meloidogyne enterolobii TaxID=390850 RepID=A0ACB1AFA3_MELEN
MPLGFYPFPISNNFRLLFPIYYNGLLCHPLLFPRFQILFLPFLFHFYPF